ncbi:MAG: LON peptidase substrate-binding domain-containing protein [Colwellia polaris]|jgi:Lon protease-like protein|tara:strand:- start:22739 stop:23314 length:576 start_codon:yes stop_codon:yes gene_type:complete
MPTINLPIFPLPIFILPQGITRLRIFEARYLKMVSLAMKNQGFVILSNDKDDKSNASHVGSWVEIINFEQSDDGILLIDVHCKCLVDIQSISQDSMKLHHGDVAPIAHWSEVNLDETTSDLSTSLSKLFSENNELNDLYQKQCFSSGDWVVARWIELIPLKLSEKKIFVAQDSYSQAKQLLQRIILADELI